MNSFKKSVLCGAIAACSALGNTAYAQLEEVVVTAQKRQESMQDVPIAITALTGNDLGKQSVFSLEGLSNTLPNVQINQWANSPDSAIFSIRGIGVNDSDPYVGTTVSVVVDGVVVGVNTAALISLFDIDRIEVLRGPQGTLFGANTTGGVINVVTKQPTGELGGDLHVAIGNYGRRVLDGAINLPISEKLAAKVSVQHNSHDGFFTNIADGRDLGSTNVTSWRGYLRYDGDNYDSTWIAEYVRSRNGSQTNLNVGDENVVLYVPGQTGLEPRYRRGQTLGWPDKNHRNTYGLTWTQNFSSDIGEFVSITNYREYDHDLYSDDDAVTPQLLQSRRQTDHKQFSQELRGTFQLNEKVQWVAGAFYFAQDYFLDQETLLDGFAPGLGQPQSQDQETWSAAVFSQIYWDISDDLRLQFGLRAAHDETKATSTTALSFAAPGELASPSDAVVPGTLVVAKGDKSWDNVGGKIGLDYRISDDTMLYGYYARGFKSGGFTGRIAVPDDIGPFDPEYLDTFEVGLKTELLDRTLRMNAAVFYNEYTDMQVTQNITYASGANSASITNAGKASSQGFELELTAVPHPDLVLNLAVAYLDSEYKEYNTRSPNPITGVLEEVSFAGNPLMNAPEWSGNISVDYTHRTSVGSLNFFLQGTYADEKFSNYTAYPQELIESIALVNGKVTWRPLAENWSIGLYGRNLTDKEYISQVLWSAPGFTSGGMGAPREVGLDVSYSF
jgi:iron complex outermembrane receptor protein